MSQRALTYERSNSHKDRPSSNDYCLVKDHHTSSSKSSSASSSRSGSRQFSAAPSSQLRPHASFDSYQSHSLAPAPMLKRTSSAMSLPSPPEELTQGRPAPNVVYFSDEDLSDDGTDVELDCDEELNESDHVRHRQSAQAMEGGASNRMRVDCNPFLVPSASALATAARERQARIEARPDHPQASPTHQARKKRVDKDRIRMTDRDSKPQVGPKTMGRGWDSPSNPFIARLNAAKESAVPRENRKPQNVTYVFRGKRVTYDIPLDALLAPEDPEDSPFPDPSPRLLFPTGPTEFAEEEERDVASSLVTPPSYKRPASSFLDALKATTSDNPESSSTAMGLPPTPVTERQKKFGPEKKLAARYEPYRRSAFASTGRDGEP